MSKDEWIAAREKIFRRKVAQLEVTFYRDATEEEENQIRKSITEEEIRTEISYNYDRESK